MESWNRWKVEKHLDYWIARRLGSSTGVAFYTWAEAYRFALGE